jgi:glucosamine-6-phosphate deaminase
MMKVYIAKDQDDWARAAADVVMETVSSNPHPVLVLPTGSTPLPLYEELIRRRRQGISFAHVTTFNLDEYIGLPKGHPQTYRVFMEQNLFSPLDIPEGQWHIPDGSAADHERAAAEYDAVIAAAGGVDLAVLGVGHNGHIVFNEPGTPADSPPT